MHAQHRIRSHKDNMPGASATQISGHLDVCLQQAHWVLKDSVSASACSFCAEQASAKSLSVLSRLCHAYLESRIAIEIKNTKIDIISRQGSRQDCETEPDAFILLCIWV